MSIDFLFCFCHFPGQHFGFIPLPSFFLLPLLSSHPKWLCCDWAATVGYSEYRKFIHVRHTVYDDKSLPPQSLPPLPEPERPLRAASFSIRGWPLEAHSLEQRPSGFFLACQPMSLIYLFPLRTSGSSRHGRKRKLVGEGWQRCRKSTSGLWLGQVFWLLIALGLWALCHVW